MKGRRESAQRRKRAVKKGGKKYDKFRVNDVRAELERGEGGMPIMPAPMRKVPRAHYAQHDAAPMPMASSGGLAPLTRVARPTRLAPLDSHATTNLASLHNTSIPQLSAIRPPPRMTMPPVR